MIFEFLFAEHCGRGEEDRLLWFVHPKFLKEACCKMWNMTNLPSFLNESEDGILDIYFFGSSICNWSCEIGGNDQRRFLVYACMGNGQKKELRCGTQASYHGIL